MTLAATAVTCIAGQRRLLDAVSLQVTPGTLHVLLGPNGAGKSTLLGVLAGDRRPQAGQVTLDDRPLGEWPTITVARHRAVMMQRDELRFPFSVDEVVALGRLPWQRRANAAGERAIVASSLAQAGAAQLAGRRYPELSGGERARVQLARALAQIHADDGDTAARYLLLDEPTASLDFAFQHQVLLTLRQLADRGTGVLAILQDPNLALRHADAVSLLAAGRVVASGSPASVLDADRLSAVYGLPIVAAKAADGPPTLLVAKGLQGTPE